MTPAELSTAIVGALTALSDEGALALPDGVPAAVTVERPRQKGHGDYATNVAMQLGKRAGVLTRDPAVDELMAEVPTAPQWSEPLNFTDPGVARARAELLVREAERRKK